MIHACYGTCYYENPITGECSNPSRYSQFEDAACYEPQDYPHTTDDLEFLDRQHNGESHE